MPFALKNTTRTTLPSIRWRFIKDEVLGKKYDLSVVIVGDKRIREINKRYRKQDRSTNVLSFVLDPVRDRARTQAPAISNGAGEIILNYSYIKKEAKEFDRTPKQHLKALYIHAFLHLKGLNHRTDKNSKKMQIQEDKLLKKFL